MKNRILILDDEEDFLEIVRVRLENNGYVVETCNDLHKALDIVGDFMPELCIIDIVWRTMGYGEYGNTIASMIRSTFPKIKILLMSSVSYSEKNEYSDDFIVKPYDSNVLLQKIEELIDE